MPSWPCRAAVEGCPSPALATAGLVLVAGLLRLGLAPLDAVLRQDAFAYLVKACEIARGNLVPMSSHAIGWPLALAPFVGLTECPSPGLAMVVARLVSIAAAIVVLLVLARLARDLVDLATGHLALLLAAVSAILISSAASAMAEPLFTLLLLAAVLDVVRAGTAGAVPWRAGLWVGLSWWVRPHGLLAAAAILLAIAADRRRAGRWTATLRRSAGVGLLACAVAAPAALQRAAAFGSLLTFGENDKLLFAAQKEHVWSANVPPVSFRTFVADLTWRGAYDRLVVRGVGRVAVQSTLYVATPILVPFIAVSAWARRRDERFRPVLIVTATWLAGVVPLADAGMRHLYPILPFALLLAADGLTRVAHGSSLRRGAVTLLVVVFVVQSLVTAVLYRQRESSPAVSDGLEWGRWAAAHVRGRLAIVEGGDLVMMHVPDTSVAGVGLMDLYAPITGLRVTRPGSFESLPEAMAWMRSIGVTHLAVDDANIERRSYLKVVRDPASRPACLRLVYSNELTATAWRQRIFEIRWADCEFR
jgi:hypothetical protein